ncbi:MAG TPA: MBL fold metallo-hydrolase [Thermoanaerobaculia bacterium]|nr:MBL fold metallo-hydrolase [Thermoanaerobaculia bacterium]
MQFKQFYLGCLAHASYLIGSEGEAAIVDPQRDVDQYIEEASRLGLKIKYVIETHLHADFVSGHRELADRSGAAIVLGAAAGAEFPHLAVSEGDELSVGMVRLQPIETPGHTPESICWLVTDGEAPETSPKLLTGDTLFIGDVGRPDLAGGRGYTPEQMAGMLYDSLHQKILTLPDEVEVYPAHGAGSACGRNISRERVSTLGIQRRTNYALQPMSREAFVGLMTADLAEAPAYFLMDAEINRRGARPLGDLHAPPLGVGEVHARLSSGAVALDVRDPADFGAGHLPRSINIGLGGQYASWAGQILSPEDPIILIADSQAQVEEGVMRLARVGFDDVVGFLEGGVQTWYDAGHQIQEVPQWTVDELKENLGSIHLVDVRSRGEYDSGRVPAARLVPLPELSKRVNEIDADRATAVICASGYRSSIGASLLQRKGFREVINVTGGTSAWLRAGYEVASGDTAPDAAAAAHRR